MVFTPEVFTDNSPISPGPSLTFKRPSARKLLYQFSELFDIKNNIAFRRLGVTKLKLKAIIADILLWSSIIKIQVHTKSACRTETQGQSRGAPSSTPNQTHTKAKYHQPHRAVTPRTRGAGTPRERAV